MLLSILVLGRNGNISRALLDIASERSALKVLSVGREEINFSERGLVSKALDKFRPTIVINAAAYTKVDDAEIERDAAQAINVQGPSEIAEWCANNRALLVHYSSDYVFDGRPGMPWKETDDRKPINYYGVTKMEGEDRITAVLDNFLIFRISWIFSPHGQNFFRTILGLAQERELLKVVNDQIGTPSSAYDIAAATYRALESYTQDKSGIYHLRNEGFATWHEFAEQIVKRASARGLPVRCRQVLGIPSSEFPSRATRPINSKMMTDKFQQTFDVRMATWSDALDRCLDIENYKQNEKQSRDAKDVKAD